MKQANLHCSVILQILHNPPAVSCTAMHQRAYPAQWWCNETMVPRVWKRVGAGCIENYFFGRINYRFSYECSFVLIQKNQKIKKENVTPIFFRLPWLSFCITVISAFVPWWICAGWLCFIYEGLLCIVLFVGLCGNDNFGLYQRFTEQMQIIDLLTIWGSQVSLICTL